MSGQAGMQLGPENKFFGLPCRGSSGYSKAQKEDVSHDEPRQRRPLPYHGLGRQSGGEGSGPDQGGEIVCQQPAHSGQDGGGGRYNRKPQQGYTVKQIIDLLAEKGVGSVEDLTETAAKYEFEYDFLDKESTGDISRLEMGLPIVFQTVVDNGGDVLPVAAVGLLLNQGCNGNDILQRIRAPSARP